MCTRDRNREKIITTVEIVPRHTGGIKTRDDGVLAGTQPGCSRREGAGQAPSGVDGNDKFEGHGNVPMELILICSDRFLASQGTDEQQENSPSQPTRLKKHEEK